MVEMKFIDMHCDTLMKAHFGKIPTVADLPDAMVDVKSMKKGGALAEFFAIFMLPEASYKRMGLTEPIDDEEYIKGMMDVFNATMAECSDDIAPAYNAADLLANEKNGKMSGFLTFEDGRAIQGSFEKFDRYYDLGIRLVSLTWNYKNCFGSPNSLDPVVMAEGLTEFGKEAITYMNEKGIIVDVSHLSDGGFADVVSIAKKPFVASHSNSRLLSPHQRNLTDDMIKIMGDKGCVTGINFGPGFLNEDTTSKESTVELMCKHIKHIVNVGGEDVIALGSDFDGIGGNMEIGNISQMQILFDALKKQGLSEALIEKVAYKNTLRVITEAMK